MPRRPMSIEPGRLEERPCPHCGELERRAFGEAESMRGELSSYALGWTTGTEHSVGRMTVGIGAGNPGGASFHMEVIVGDGGWAMRLVDEPFEDVPEGGPDIGRDEGLAHDTIEFVWWVADEVMDQDPRAGWMRHWVEETMAFVTEPIAQREQPVRHVIRDDDGDWQLLCGTDDPGDDLVPLHLYHSLDRDQTLLELLDLEPGHRADRSAAGEPWRRRRGD